MKADRDSFGPRLRLERERRGITLKDIAESTKIKESLFAELERSDFSKWPQGIFRRAHLCDYVSAIGLPTQPILAEYLRLFPEESPVQQSEELKPTDAIGKPQAGQGVQPLIPALPMADRAWILCFDLAAVCLMSSIVAGIVGLSLWPTVALVGLGYSAAGSVCFAQSAGAYVQHWIRGKVGRHNASHGTSETPVPEVRLIASRRLRGSSPDRNANRELGVHSRRASA